MAGAAASLLPFQPPPSLLLAPTTTLLIEEEREMRWRLQGLQRQQQQQLSDDRCCRCQAAVPPIANHHRSSAGGVHSCDSTRSCRSTGARRAHNRPCPRMCALLRVVQPVARRSRLSPPLPLLLLAPRRRAALPPRERQRERQARRCSPAAPYVLQERNRTRKRRENRMRKNQRQCTRLLFPDWFQVSPARAARRRKTCASHATARALGAEDRQR